MAIGWRLDHAVQEGHLGGDLTLEVTREDSGRSFGGLQCVKSGKY